MSLFTAYKMSTGQTIRVNNFHCLHPKLINGALIDEFICTSVAVRLE